MRKIDQSHCFFLFAIRFGLCRLVIAALMSLIVNVSRNKSSKLCLVFLIVAFLIVSSIFHELIEYSWKNFFVQPEANVQERKDVESLRKHYLIRPSNVSRRSPPLNTTYYAQLGQDEIVDRLLNGRRNGFYFEAGAYDGFMISNTLFFEEQRGWTGLLIEANPKLFQKLNSSGRYAYRSNSCLSLHSYSVQLNFTFADYLGGLTVTEHQNMITGHGLIQCFPIHRYFEALNLKHIDYFSLDIEGAELEVLQQINFHRIRIDVLTIEYARKYHRSPEGYETLNKVREIILSTGLYHEVFTIQDVDVVFMRNAC